MALEKPVDHQSVSHPSHNHPLLSVIKIQDKDDEIICSGCEEDLTGQAFKCTEENCDYFIHKSCFDLPREVKHKSHPEHPLTLLHSSPYGDSFECNGCGETGSGFTYNCSECQYDLHVGCVALPETVEREDHEHPLPLLYINPCKAYEGAIFTCSTCEGEVSDDNWVYYCKECDYGTHVYKQSCEASKLNSLIQANFMMMRGMQLQARTNALHTSMINARK